MNFTLIKQDAHNSTARSHKSFSVFCTGAEKYKVFVPLGKCFDLKAISELGSIGPTNELHEGPKLVGQALDGFETLRK